MAEEKKKFKSKSDQLLFEIEEIKHSQERMRRDFKKLTPSSDWIKVGRKLFAGMIYGVGFAIGTTVIAAVIFLFLDRIIKTPVVQTWIGKTLQQTIETGIEKRLPNNLLLP